MQGLWRLALRSSTKLLSPAATGALHQLHQGTLIHLQPGMAFRRPSARLVHLGYRYAIDAPKGVEGERWHKRKVKKKKRKVYSPYRIKAARFYSRQRCLANLKQAAEREAAEEMQASSGRRPRARSPSHAVPPPEPPRRSNFVSAMIPVTTPRSSEIPEYCKPVVKRIDPWKAPWTPPYKKPRQEYQVGRARPLSKPLARVVKRDKEAAKAHARERKLTEMRRRKNRIHPKERMEFT